MECKSVKVSPGKDEENPSEETESTNSNIRVDESTLVPSSPRNNAQVSKVDWKDGDAGGTSEDVNNTGEVNMEALITPDDVIRAGGFGARDDINSFLPVASDSTDFEASILDAKGYEEPQGEPSRPGLGWRDLVWREA